MTILDLKFINKPTIDEILSYKNLYINGSTFSGKSVLLHQIINELSKKENFNNFELYIHDAKGMEFNGINKNIAKIFTYNNELTLLKFLKNEVERRQSLLSDEILKEKTIVVISDEYSISKLSDFYLSIFTFCTQLKIILILTSQLRDDYYINKKTLNSGTVFFLNINMKTKDRIIEKIIGGE